MAFNSPRIHEVDVQAFVKAWREEGNLAAVMKDDGGVRARGVLERKVREHKPSFLGIATEVG